MPESHCHACGTPVAIDPPIARTAECGSCGGDLRCCKNCRHYDVAYNNHCRETEAEPVPDKDRRNFCEFFDLARRPARGDHVSQRAADARAKLDALFGGPGVAPREDARTKIDRLFGPPEAADDEP